MREHNAASKITEVVAVDAVAVEEVSHGGQAQHGGQGGRGLPLEIRRARDVAAEEEGAEDEGEGEVRRRQVQKEALLVNSWGKKTVCFGVHKREARGEKPRKPWLRSNRVSLLRACCSTGRKEAKNVPTPAKGP